MKPAANGHQKAAYRAYRERG